MNESLLLSKVWEIYY